jgi:nucleotide-binding universal stress UspA family protein
MTATSARPVRRSIPPPPRAGIGPAPGSAITGLETIVLATDLSQASAAATDRAIELAVRLGSRLLIVHVFSTMKGMVPLSRPRTVEEREQRTTSAGLLVQRARAAGADASFLVWEGDPGDGIIAAAEAESADMIVVGSHARGSVGRYILGSVSDHVVHHARCPVLVVRPRDADLT